jgi:YidC/Oxa1 family membrane protein insertase
MDKRLSIALLLTAIVVAVTPILFPTPRRTPSTPAAGPEQKTESAAVQLPAPAVSQPAPVQRGVVIDSSAQVSPPDVLQGEVTTIDTRRAVYQFSSLGAAPVSVTMKDYQNLSASKGLVDLKVPGRSLIRYSLVAQGDTIPLDNLSFQKSELASAGGGQAVTYRANAGSAVVTISYVVSPGKYVVQTSGRVDGVSGPSFLLIDMPSSLPATEADTIGDIRTRSYSLKPTRSNARGIPFEKLDPGEKRLEAEPMTWAAVRNKYFVVGLINPQGSTFEEMTITGGPRTSKVATTASAVVVKAVRDGTFAFDIYAGPQQSTELLALGRDFDNVNPYGWSFLQPVVNPIAALCIKLLLWLHDTFKLSYGWVLVIFGIFIRIALWPLNQSAMRSSLKMQEIQPRLAEVQKKYKDKPERQREEMMKVYREAGASPFTALSGCLPMLIPMPVLFALFFVFQNTIEFRGVPFLWLADISVKDPFYILPVLMGVSMYILSWIGLRNAPPNPQAKMMSYMFPVMMTFVLANMASGLNLYYTAQNLAALPQQWLLAKERQRARKT